MLPQRAVQTKNDKMSPFLFLSLTHQPASYLFSHNERGEEEREEMLGHHSRWKVMESARQRDKELVSL